MNLRYILSLPARFLVVLPENHTTHLTFSLTQLWKEDQLDIHFPPCFMIFFSLSLLSCCLLGFKVIVKCFQGLHKVYLFSELHFIQMKSFLHSEYTVTLFFTTCAYVYINILLYIEKKVGLTAFIYLFRLTTKKTTWCEES